MTKKKTNKVKLTKAQMNFRDRAKFVELQKNRLADAAEGINSSYEALKKVGAPVEPLCQAYEIVTDLMVILVDTYLTTSEEKEKRDYKPPVEAKEEDNEPEE